MEKRGHKINKGKEAGNDSDNLLKCLCAIDQEIAYFKECGLNKHVSHLTREKILFCMIMRELGKLDRKLDKILRELNSDWGSDSWFDCDSSTESDSHCSDSDSDSDSDSHCHKHSCCHSHCHHKPHIRKG